MRDLKTFESKTNHRPSLPDLSKVEITESPPIGYRVRVGGRGPRIIGHHSWTKSSILFSRTFYTSTCCAATAKLELFIGNCYTVSPRCTTARFRRVQSMTIMGKPLIVDLDLHLILLNCQGHFRYCQGHFRLWAAAMVEAYPGLEKVHLKRMSANLLLLKNEWVYISKSIPLTFFFRKSTLVGYN